jgi:hypothetical protein
MNLELNKYRNGPKTTDWYLTKTNQNNVIDAEEKEGKKEIVVYINNEKIN